MPVTLEEQIRLLEQDAGEVAQVAEFTGRVLGELMKSAPPTARLEEIRRSVRSARDLAKHGDPASADQLVAKAKEVLASVQQWLAVGDLGITPFALRTYLEKSPPERGLHVALIRYFLTKQPHAEYDRDKLDYLLTIYFRAEKGDYDPRWERPEALHPVFAELCQRVSPRPLRGSDDVMQHELESLIAMVGDYHDFDQLVQARMVERARALKTNLGEAFFHPRLLPTIVRFNLVFRRRFDELLQAQISLVRREARERLQEAWQLVREIESAYEAMVFPEGAERVGGPIVPEAGGGGEMTVGRPLQILDERLPIERLVRPGEPTAKEKELRGIIQRLARFVEKLPREQAASEKVVFPLRHAHLELVHWEREVFAPATLSAAPESAKAIQTALGLVAWLEEELAQYNETRPHRYLWKTHFDALSYAVLRTVELLRTIRSLLRAEAPEDESAWFPPLLHTSLRLGIALNHLAPVFDEP